MSFRLFAVTAPGLEKYTSTELNSLGFKSHRPVSSEVYGDTKEEAGGVEFEANLSDMYRVNLRLRTANRIIVRLGEFSAVSFPELRKKAARFAWETFLKPGQPVALRVTCHKSKLYHSGGVAERIAGAIGDHLGKSCAMEKFDESARFPPQLIMVRFVHDQCTISVDTSGELLHRRGYRLETAKAPLRATLAAGMLMASNWDLHSPVVDPFCGSGTIPIEAAMMTRRIAPGRNRRFAFMNWPDFNQELWEDVLSRTISEETPIAAVIQASDRDAGAIQIARNNAERASVLSDIKFNCQAVSNLQPAGSTGWIVTNPPYGVRISQQKDLRDLYARFGTVLHDRFSGWKFAILCSSDILIGQMHLEIIEKIHLVNGGIPVSLYCGNI
ncbi:MAG: class I SAM-dependent RNA methyltransferase [Leptolinea sp.]|jgi:putative N6-adenine-specific DNA methylase|nr:class I SAM-dependent RNA methyltransferase [Leptolinea sp.]